MNDNTITKTLTETHTGPQTMADCIETVRHLFINARLEARAASSFAVTTTIDTVIAELAEADLALSQYQDDEVASPETLIRDGVFRRIVEADDAPTA